MPCATHALGELERIRRSLRRLRRCGRATVRQEVLHSLPAAWALGESMFTPRITPWPLGSGKLGTPWVCMQCERPGVETAGVGIALMDNWPPDAAARCRSRQPPQSRHPMARCWPVTSTLLSSGYSPGGRRPHCHCPGCPRRPPGAGRLRPADRTGRPIVALARLAPGASRSCGWL